MSDPLYKHLWDPRDGSQYVPARFAQMHCDHPGCRWSVARAPRITVCSTMAPWPGHKPLRMLTTLHYCEMHKGEITIHDLLTDKVKADFERVAKIKRPIEFKCDFDKAFLEFILVTTPEYRQFLRRLELPRDLATEPRRL